LVIESHCVCVCVCVCVWITLPESLHESQTARSWSQVLLTTSCTHHTPPSLCLELSARRPLSSAEQWLFLAGFIKDFFSLRTSTQRIWDVNENALYKLYITLHYTTTSHYSGKDLWKMCRPIGVLGSASDGMTWLSHLSHASNKSRYWIQASFCHIFQLKSINSDTDHSESLEAGVATIAGGCFGCQKIVTRSVCGHQLWITWHCFKHINNHSAWMIRRAERHI